ncbi:hypothetical protein DVJ77_09750 [Dyella tabacisoli]|uniref:Uncharacterized protein n=2 Tax=Dyella tabacisoli TaxID=2282381 RepID=A0A369UM93_9GAMM|nr:hypothetical protein DVJ77_09750 [Dyella tabacisoli]
MYLGISRVMFSKTSLIVALILVLTGCGFLYGTYRVQGFTAQGKPLGEGVVKATVKGSDVKAERERICMIYPEATVVITNVETGIEPARKSPYQCTK